MSDFNPPEDSPSKTNSTTQGNLTDSSGKPENNEENPELSTLIKSMSVDSMGRIIIEFAEPLQEGFTPSTENVVLSTGIGFTATVADSRSAMAISFSQVTTTTGMSITLYNIPFQNGQKIEKLTSSVPSRTKG